MDMDVANNTTTLVVKTENVIKSDSESIWAHHLSDIAFITILIDFLVLSPDPVARLRGLRLPVLLCQSQGGWQQLGVMRNTKSKYLK